MSFSLSPCRSIERTLGKRDEAAKAVLLKRGRTHSMELFLIVITVSIIMLRNGEHLH